MGTFWHRYHNQYKEIRKLWRSYHQNLLQYTAYPCGLLDKTFYILISRSDTSEGSGNLKLKCGASLKLIHVEFGPNDHWEAAPHFRFHYELYIDLSLSTFFWFALIFVDDSYSSLFLLNIVVAFFWFTARHFLFSRLIRSQYFENFTFETENLNK